MDSLGGSRRSSACSSVLSQEELESYGLDEEQMRNLKRTFDQFDSDKSGALKIDTVHTILKMMGYKVSTASLQVNYIHRLSVGIFRRKKNLHSASAVCFGARTVGLKI